MLLPPGVLAIFVAVVRLLAHGAAGEGAGGHGALPEATEVADPAAERGGVGLGRRGFCLRDGDGGQLGLASESVPGLFPH